MKKKGIALMLAMLMITSLVSVSAFAADPAPNVNDMLGTAFNSMLADIMGAAGLILPIALSIFGLLFAARIGIKMFRSFAGGSAG
jgi:hypothetical protein